jgi:hypothetical protein
MVKTRIVWALVWLNVALLVVWAIRVTSPQAVAQLRRPGDYLMIPGEIVGGVNGVVYVVDQTNGRLTAISFDQSSNRLTNMAPLDLNQLFQAAAAPAGRPGY